MPPKRVAYALLSLLILIGIASTSATADDITVKRLSSSEIHLANVSLIDKDGHAVQFSKEAVADRIVVINFIYTNCRTLCPLASATFRLLQDKLGDRLAKDAWLISLTLDPYSDTPDRLREFSEQFEPAAGWLWLTGKPYDIESVLKGLGVSAANFKEHAPLTLVGDAKFGRWTQLNSTPNPARIELELKRLWAARESRSAAEVSGITQDSAQ